MRLCTASTKVGAHGPIQASLCTISAFNCARNVFDLVHMLSTRFRRRASESLSASAPSVPSGPHSPEFFRTCLRTTGHSIREDGENRVRDAVAFRRPPHFVSKIWGSLRHVHHADQQAVTVHLDLVGKFFPLMLAD